MTVETALDAVFLQRRHDLRGAGAGVDRRIMQKHELFKARLCGIQAHFQPPDLPVHHLFVVGFPHIEQPAPRAAQSVPFHGVGVVVQDVQGIEAFRF